MAQDCWCSNPSELSSTSSGEPCLALLQYLAQPREADAAESVCNVCRDPEESDLSLQGEDQALPPLGQDVSRQVGPPGEQCGVTAGQTDQGTVHSLGALAPTDHPHGSQAALGFSGKTSMDD